MTDQTSSPLRGNKIRVAHILRKYDPCEWGGTETAVYDLIQHLRDQNVDSVVYAPTIQNSRLETDPIRAQGTTVHRFKAFVPIIGAREIDRRALTAIGGNIVSFEAFWQLHKERELDVIHAHMLGRLGSIARMVARQKRIPFVITIHGGYLDLPPQVADKLAVLARRGLDYGRIFGFLLRSRRLVEDADAIITVNSREAELLRRKFPKSQVELVPHGLSTSTYDRDHREAALAFFPAIQRRRIVLCVGRIDSVKNQGFLVEAIPQLQREWPNLSLVLVGPSTDTHYERHLRQRIHDLNLDDSVLLAGLLPPNDPRLIGLYQCADVFVLPSLSETFGLVLLEAWAASCPVIASATAGAKQLVRNGENGFLFPIDDRAGLIQAFRQTFQSDARRKALGESGQKMVRTHYDSRAAAHRVQHIYADLRANARKKTRNLPPLRPGQP